MKVLSIIALVLFVSANSFANESAPVAGQPANNMSAPAEQTAPAKEMKAEKVAKKSKKKHSRK